MILETKKREAFTIIELMLAMTFVSFLLIAVAMMTIHMSNMYVKGNTLKELNSAGRTVNSDLTKTFNSIASIEWAAASSDFAAGKNYISLVDGSGSFCTGSYSYLWNGASIINSSQTNKNVPVRFTGSSQSDDSIRLIKVVDPSKSYCASKSGWTTIPSDSRMTNLLPQGETNLMLYGISFQSNDNSLYDSASNQRIFNISYILGTKNNNGIIDVSGMKCQPPANSAGMEDYCAINKFELTVRTIGRG